MDLDFVGSPSSRRSSKVLLALVDEQKIKIQHISSEPLNPSSPQTDYPLRSRSRFSRIQPIDRTAPLISYEGFSQIPVLNLVTHSDHSEKIRIFSGSWYYP